MMPKNNAPRSLVLTIAAFAIIAVLSVAVPAQDDDTPFDKALVPKTGKTATDFAPRGWKVEDKVEADVTADGAADLVIKLIEDKPSTEDNPVNRNRVLIVAINNGKGTYNTSVITDTMLQCTMCGGAFYGMMEAPSDVAVEKGVIILSKESGSREIVFTKYKFRWDPEDKRFELIGFDLNYTDRISNDVVTESTNYITGKRITETTRSKKKTRKVVQLTSVELLLEYVDTHNFELEVMQRLGLD